MPRPVTLLLPLAVLVLVTGCSAPFVDDPTATPVSTASPTGTPTATPEFTPTATFTYEPPPTDTPITGPQIAATNYDPAYDLPTVLSRVERLRGLTATEPIRYEEVELDYLLRNGSTMEPGDPFDYPDEAGKLGQSGAKALQLYSSARVPYLGYAAAGTAGANRVTVGNETHLARVSGQAPVITAAHELTHALQAQHGLERPTRRPTTTDEDIAAMSLTEGDATLAAQRYWERHDPGGVSPFAARNDTSPRGRWTKGLYDKPRLYGALYLRPMAESPAERNAAIRSPPNTTAEVMHPALDADLPGEGVPRPAVPWSVAGVDRVGEMPLRYALRTNGVPYGRAANASAGWRNDTLVSYGTDAATVYWGTRWANATEAREFADAWRSMLDRRNATRNGDLLTVPGTPNTTTMQYRVERSGSLVFVAASENASHATRIGDCIHLHDRDAFVGRDHADADGDGVPDGCERSRGMDPTAADTDGDGISDRVELTRTASGSVGALPALDPTRKDVVLDVVYASSVDEADRLSDPQVRNLTATWAGFPVENSGNRSGVRLHVRRAAGSQLAGAFGPDFDTGEVNELYEERYGTPPGNSTVNMLVVTEMDVGSTDVTAFGEKGGNVAVVRASEARNLVVTHELMHLVLGTVRGERDCDIPDDGGHTCDGYLAPGGEAEPHLTDLLVRALNREWEP
ncbi:hypothetical protein [Halorarius halobius]|uniref:hypothetical protein n=1 Tax=Halorarius halobius TaxID=2962671 RepID=UPI0020CEA388|nr:hypothetical protein [Halorarius halobius]